MKKLSRIAVKSGIFSCLMHFMKAAKQASDFQLLSVFTGFKSDNSSQSFQIQVHSPKYTPFHAVILKYFLILCLLFFSVARSTLKRLECLSNMPYSVSRCDFTRKKEYVMIPLHRSYLVATLSILPLIQVCVRDSDLNCYDLRISKLFVKNSDSGEK